MITTQEHQNNLVAAAFHRELEVYQYQVNIDNYTTMLTSLPVGEWPESLSIFSSTLADQLPAEMEMDDVLTVADYQYRDRLVNLLRSEKIEQAKARRVLEAMKAQIGADYATLLAAYKATQTA